MNGPEVVKLCAIITALCPSQKLTEYTPDAWELVLEDIPFAEAQDAVRVIYREQGSDTEWVRKIEADDIIRQVKRTRARRIEHFTDIVPPAGLTQAEERAWLRSFYRRAGQGQPVETNTRGELKSRPQLQLLGRNVRDDTNPTQKETG